MLKSFTEFVNESRKGIFKGDLRVGADRNFINRSKKTTAYQVLEFIYKGGEEGRRYTDIVKFIIESRGGRYNWKTDRGYWATNLLTYGWNSGGNLLGLYCNKVGKNYVLKPEIKEFFDLEEFGNLDISPEAINFLSKLNAIGD